jgi:hypothetical protein
MLVVKFKLSEMKFYLIIYLLLALCCQSCNIPIDNRKTPVEPIQSIDINSISEQAILLELNNDSIVRDGFLSWRFDKKLFIPVQNPSSNQDSITVEETIKLINEKKFFRKIQLKLTRVSNDTIYIEIPEAEFLTEKIGNDLAQDFLSTTTFILTDFEKINFVNLEFKSKSQIKAGVYNRDYFYNNSILKGGGITKLELDIKNTILPEIMNLSKNEFVKLTEGLNSLVMNGFNLQTNFDSLIRVYWINEKIEINKYKTVLDSLIQKYPESIKKRRECLTLKTLNKKMQVCRDTIDPDIKSRSWYDTRGYKFGYIVLKVEGYEYEIYYLYNPKTLDWFTMEGKPLFSEENLYVFGLLESSNYDAGRFEIVDLKKPGRNFAFTSWPLDEVYKVKETFYFKVRSNQYSDYFHYYKVDFSRIL